MLLEELEPLEPQFIDPPVPRSSMRRREKERKPALVNSVAIVFYQEELEPAGALPNRFKILTQKLVEAFVHKHSGVYLNHTTHA